MVAFVDENSSATQQIPVALQREIECGIQKRMAWTDKCRKGLTLGRDQILFESNSLVTLQDRIAAADQPIPVADRSGNMCEFVPPGLALTNGPTQLLERLDKERFNVVGLKALRLGAFHIFTNTGNAAGVHCVVRERPLLQKDLKVGAVHGVFYGLSQTRTNVGAFTVTNSLNQKIPERPSFEL